MGPVQHRCGIHQNLRVVGCGFHSPSSPLLFEVFIMCGFSSSCTIYMCVKSLICTGVFIVSSHYIMHSCLHDLVPIS